MIDTYDINRLTYLINQVHISYGASVGGVGSLPPDMIASVVKIMRGKHIDDVAYVYIPMSTDMDKAKSIIIGAGYKILGSFAKYLIITKIDSINESYDTRELERLKNLFKIHALEFGSATGFVNSLPNYKSELVFSKLRGNKDEIMYYYMPNEANLNRARLLLGREGYKVIMIPELPHGEAYLFFTKMDAINEVLSRRTKINLVRRRHGEFI